MASSANITTTSTPAPLELAQEIAWLAAGARAGIGSIKPRPVVIDGAVVDRATATVTTRSVWRDTFSRCRHRGRTRGGGVRVVVAITTMAR